MEGCRWLTFWDLKEVVSNDGLRDGFTTKDDISVGDTSKNEPSFLKSMFFL